MKTTKKTRLGVKGSILIPIVILNAIIMGLLGFFAIQQSDANTRKLAAEILAINSSDTTELLDKLKDKKINL